MTLMECERHLEKLDNEADEIAILFSNLDTARLQLIASAVDEELAMRYEGKPSAKSHLH